MSPGIRHVLVVGGGSGIGRATALALVARGARVAVAGRRRAPLEELAAAHPDSVIALPADVTRTAERAALLEQALEALGGLDGLVYSAGVVTHEPPRSLSEAAVRAQLETNLLAPLLLSAAALERLEPGGAVVLVGSTLAERPVVTSAAYSASKAGLRAAAKSLALAGAARGVRVNLVSPGVVATDMVPPERQEALAPHHALGRIGEPEDVAQAILHLLEAPWVTGAELVADGGLLLGGAP